LSFTIPKDIVEHLDTVFPKSKDRVRIAISLLGYDHMPTRDEKRVIGDANEKDIRTIENIIERLIEEQLFTSEFGSVPLYREMEKLRLNPHDANPVKQLPSKDIIHAGEYNGIPLYTIDLRENKKGAEEGGEEDAPWEDKREEDGKKKGITAGDNTGAEVPIHSDARDREIKELKVKQEQFETVISAKFGSIEKTLNRILEQKNKVEKPATVVDVVSPLKGKAKPMEEEDPPEQPANPGPAANPNDPFFNMTKEEVIDFYMNNPQTGRKLPGARARWLVPLLV